MKNKIVLNFKVKYKLFQKRVNGLLVIVKRGFSFKELKRSRGLMNFRRSMLEEKSRLGKKRIKILCIKKEMK